MTTKAEAMAAIEAVGLAVQAAAKVVSALVEGPAVPVAQVADVIITDKGNGELLVTTRPGIDKVRWSLVSNNAAGGYPWYGIVHDDAVTAGGLSITPQYARDGDFIKVLWGANYANWLDGPKVTKAVSVQSLPPTSVPVSSSPAGKFVSGITAILNMERTNFLPMSYNNVSLTKQPYYDYLMSVCGINAVRFFIPYNGVDERGVGVGGPPDVSRWDGILDAVQAANMAGMKVFIGCTDVLDKPTMDSHWGSVVVHVDNVAKRIAERGMDPNRVAVECANELAQFDNTYWNPMRLLLHDTIRKRLPGYRIVHGACGWNGWQGFDSTWAKPGDMDIITQFHHYEYMTDWNSVGSKLLAFSNAIGVPMVNGEFGDDFEHMDYINDGDRWIANWKNMVKAVPLLCMAPWAVIGDKHDFRLNRSSTDPRLATKFETAMKQCTDIVRAAPGWGK